MYIQAIQPWGRFKRPTLQKVSPLDVKDKPRLMSLSPLSTLEPESSESESEEETVTKSHTCPNLTQCLAPITTTQKTLTKPQQLGVMFSRRYQIATENLSKFQSSLQQRLRSLDRPRPKKSSLKIQTLDILPQDSLPKKTLKTPQTRMHCRVMQIINTSSDKSCDYELSIYLDGQEQSVHTGCLSKTEKMSVARPQEEPLELDIQIPFELSFKVAARYTPSRFQHGLARLGWVRHLPGPLPIVGHAVLQFKQLQNASVMRFRLVKEDPLDPMNLELVVDLKQVKELPPATLKFPWAYHLKQSALWTSESLKNSTLLKDPVQVSGSRQHCQQGDYLTLYTRGSAHPAWKRFWVTLEQDRLKLFDFSYKASKEPVSVLALALLVSVSKPSMDDCENVGMARKVSIMLQLDPTRALLSNTNACPTEQPLEGKIFLYCDDEARAHHWRRALVAHTTTPGDKTQQSIDIRFLW